jgi:hypothetical protein
MKKKAKIRIQDAAEAFRKLKSLGWGYVPYSDVEGEGTIGNAVCAAVADGWELCVDRAETDSVAILVNGDGDVMAIGDASDAGGALAIDITSEVTV